VPAILHGPEIVKPLRKIPAQESGAGGSGATNVVVAPSAITNNSSASTGIVMSVSSIDPKKSLLGMN